MRFAVGQRMPTLGLFLWNLYVQRTTQRAPAANVSSVSNHPVDEERQAVGDPTALFDQHKQRCQRGRPSQDRRTHGHRTSEAIVAWSGRSEQTVRCCWSVAAIAA
jgi:hypothetical protein